MMARKTACSLFDRTSDKFFLKTKPIAVFIPQRARPMKKQQKKGLEEKALEKRKWLRDNPALVAPQAGQGMPVR